MRKSPWGYVVLSVLWCSLLMAEEPVKDVNRIIPEQFFGQWIEKRSDSKEPGNITVSDEGIVWVQSGADREIIKSEDITISGDEKTLMFSSGVVVVQGTPISAEKLDCRASVVLEMDKDGLVVEISGIREKVQRCGAVPPKGYAGITREIVDGKMITCIKYVPEVHRYRKFK